MGKHHQYTLMRIPWQRNLQALACSCAGLPFGCLQKEYQIVCGANDSKNRSGLSWIPLKKFPEATIMALWWMRVEDMVLTHWVTHVLETCAYPAHLSLHFDGIRLDKSSVREAFHNENNLEASANAFIGSCEAHLQKTLGIDLRLVHKKHVSLFGLLDDDQSGGRNSVWPFQIWMEEVKS